MPASPEAGYESCFHVLVEPGWEGQQRYGSTQKFSYIYFVFAFRSIPIVSAFAYKSERGFLFVRLFLQPGWRCKVRRDTASTNCLTYEAEVVV